MGQTRGSLRDEGRSRGLLEAEPESQKVAVEWELDLLVYGVDLYGEGLSLQQGSIDQVGDDRRAGH